MVSFIRKQQIYHQFSIKNDVTENPFIYLPEKWETKPTNKIEQMLYKIGALKNSATYTKKHLRWSLFFNKFTGFQSATLLKKDSNTGVFLQILPNF